MITAKLSSKGQVTLSASFRVSSLFWASTFCLANMRKRVTRVHNNALRMVQDLHEKITAGNERVSGKSRGKVKVQNRFCRALARFVGKKNSAKSPAVDV